WHVFDVRQLALIEADTCDEIGNRRQQRSTPCLELHGCVRRRVIRDFKLAVRTGGDGAQPRNYFSNVDPDGDKPATHAGRNIWSLAAQRFERPTSTPSSGSAHPSLRR